MARKSQKAAAKTAVEVDEIELPKAKLVDREAKADPSVLRAKLAVFALVIVGGWAFILTANKFHVTAPVVFVCLGYLALVLTVVNLWRTGAAAAGPASDDIGWGRPIGARGELEKEKRTLLKGIKEAEFDAAMGKLSKADSESLIRDYRARAIEVIKELDSLSADSAMSVRDQIALEVRARIALDASDKPSNRAKKAALAQELRAEVRRTMTSEPASVTASINPAATAKAAPLPRPMPAKLMVIVGILCLGSVLNFVGGSVVGIIVALLQIALALGVLSGNDGVRVFLRGLAGVQILLMLVTLVTGVAAASDHGRGGDLLSSPLFWLIIMIGVGTPSFLLWSLGQHDVRDWMFQRSFGLAPPTHAPGDVDYVDDEDDDHGREAAVKAKVAAAEQRAAAAEQRAAVAEAKAAAVTTQPAVETSDAAPEPRVPSVEANAKASAEADAIAARVQADKVALAEAKAAAAQAAAEAAEAKAAAARAAAEAAEAKAAAAESSDESKGERA